MTTTSQINEEQLRQLREDLLDSLDEELELELDDRWGSEGAANDSVIGERAHYFRELLRLQSELVMLQDWVVKTGHRMVILFEGRDAAGKGGGYQTHHTAPQPPRVPSRRTACAQ